MTTEAYQSVEKLYEAGRIHALEDFGDIGSAASITELKRMVATYASPLWHILRPKTGKTAEVEAKLRKEFPGAQVILWDSAKRPVADSDDDSSSECSKTLEDINVLLSTPPATHSFVLLKNMFYAAKTLNDQYVGVLWDRLGGIVGGDNARLQSLLGRACGYGKSKRTVIYTSTETVERYLGFWKALCRSIDADTTTDEHKASDLNRRMPGVVAVATADGSAKVAPVQNAANPTASTADNAVPAGAGRVKTNPDNYTVEWQEFKTFEEAKKYASRVQLPDLDTAGFYLSSTSKGPVRLSYADVKSIQGGKTTSAFGNPNSLKVGNTTARLRVCYKNLSDRNSVVFVVGKLTRIA